MGGNRMTTTLAAVPQSHAAACAATTAQWLKTALGTVFATRLRHPRLSTHLFEEEWWVPCAGVRTGARERRALTRPLCAQLAATG